MKKIGIILLVAAVAGAGYFFGNRNSSPTQAAAGIKLARLIAQDKGMSNLMQVAVPKRIVLDAPVVTADNVEEYLPLGFES